MDLRQQAEGRRDEGTLGGKGSIYWKIVRAPENRVEHVVLKEFLGLELARFSERL